MGRPRGAVLPCVWCVALLVAAVVSYESSHAVAAQSSTPDPATLTFSSVSARASSSAMRQLNVLPGGRLSIVGFTMAELIRRAYGPWEYAVVQIEGPTWLKGERFDIEVRSNTVIRSNAGVLDKFDIAATVLALLRNHYKLSADVVNREVSGYNLVRIPEQPLGDRLRPSQGKCIGPLESLALDAPPTSTSSLCPFIAGPGLLKGEGLSMSQVAGLLADFGAVRSVVRDNTGLTGTYDVDLKFDPVAVRGDGGAFVPNTNARPGSDLNSALRQQLGLALESARLKANFIVVKSIEKPQ